MGAPKHSVMTVTTRVDTPGTRSGPPEVSGNGHEPDPPRVRVYVTLPPALARKFTLWKQWTRIDASRLFELWVEEQMGDFEVRGG